MEIFCNGETLYVSDEMYTRYSELIVKIISSDLMDNLEKQYWFDILPNMDDEQVSRLFSILKSYDDKIEKIYTNFNS